MKKHELSMEERVIRGLKACGDRSWNECQKCPYNGLDTGLDKCWEQLCADAARLISRQAACMRILDDALDESAVLLGELSDEVAQLKRDAKATKVPPAKAVGKEYFSAEEVRHMTIDEVGVHREAILESMKYWYKGPEAPAPRRGARGFLGKEDI